MKILRNDVLLSLPNCAFSDILFVACHQPRLEYFFFYTTEVGTQYISNLITYFVDCLDFNKNEGKNVINTDYI